MIEIKPAHRIDAEISVPASKSYTHRILIASALSDGICTVINPLDSEDTRLTQKALNCMGVTFEDRGDRKIVRGVNGKPGPWEKPIDLGNSGTSMRLLTGVAAIGTGHYILTGTARMRERPIDDLLGALKHLEIPADSLTGNGCPPVKIQGGEVSGGEVKIDCSVSSQFLSALLLIGPFTKNGLQIHVTRGPVSKPYIDMTETVMKRMGVDIERDGYTFFHVPGKQHYRAGIYEVEPDISNASYFWAAAAVSGGSVKVRGIQGSSRQGDMGILGLLEKMGCRVERDSEGVRVIGGNLSGIDVDMGDMPDMVPTLAVIAARAKGMTTIRNVHHLRAKECDRLDAVANELSKMGIRTISGPDFITIEGGSPEGAVIDVYNDHRIAMSFAVAGLNAPGTKITNPGCVDKSFPGFWDVFRELYEK